MTKRVSTGGGWPAVRYLFKMGRRVGLWRLYRALATKNACKTCALGMGGQRGGMVNEQGHWPEVCKKSMQAMAADMQEGITPEFFSRYSIAQLRTLSPRDLEHLGRLVSPVYAGPGDTHFRCIGWGEALDRVGGALKATQPNRTFFYFSGRSSNEAGFLLQMFARLYGTNNVNNCSYYCHQASGVGLTGSLGTGTATLRLEDLDQCDLFFLIGGNPASNHPRLMRTLMQIRRRGGKVIVVNPVKETGLVNFSVPSDPWSLLFGTPIASMYVQPHIGGDSAWILGVCKGILERGAISEDYLKAGTEGLEAFREHVMGLSWDEITSQSGVSRPEIEQMAEAYAAANNAVFAWTMGITHHAHGVHNVQNIVNLALLRGMIGRRGAGVMPIRGHSNVQGIGSIGVTPVLKQAIFERLQNHFGVSLPTTPGYDTMACMEAADAGDVDVAISLGGNLFGSNPDANFAHRAMSKIGLHVMLSTTMNTGHVWGTGRETLILPVLARDEEPQPTTQESMFNYVRYSEGGKPRHQGPRSEVAVIAALAQHVFAPDHPVNWASMEQHANIRAAIARIVPGWEAMNQMDETKQEFEIKGRVFDAPHFPTASGKAKFWCHPIPPLRGHGDELRLMTVRSEGQFNTVVYEEEDLYRGQERRDVILLSPADMAARGLEENQPVTVRSNTGVLHGILARSWDIRAGNALMYYPEANVLVDRSIDPNSRTPAFKGVLITLEPQTLAPSLPADTQLVSLADS